jgi:hypothetical protein
MNDDASTFDLPEYIHSRLQPQILIEFPERDEEALILRRNLPYADESILKYVVNFLQRAHESQERYTVRDGINVARYAIKLLQISNGKSPDEPLGAQEALIRAVTSILGEDATFYL